MQSTESAKARIAELYEIVQTAEGVEERDASLAEMINLCNRHQLHTAAHSIDSIFGGPLAGVMKITHPKSYEAWSVYQVRLQSEGGIQ